VARQKQAAPSGGKRISVNEAFRKLRPALGPHGAENEMNAAMLRDDKPARLFCDGEVVDPNFIRDHLLVKGPGSRDAAGRVRRSAEIVATRALEKPVESYTWQMDADGIEALLRKPSRTQVAIREIAAEKWPDGYECISTAQIIKIVGAELKKRGIHVPHRSTFERALGRKKS